MHASKQTPTTTGTVKVRAGLLLSEQTDMEQRQRANKSAHKREPRKLAAQQATGFRTQVFSGGRSLTFAFLLTLKFTERTAELFCSRLGHQRRNSCMWGKSESGHIWHICNVRPLPLQWASWGMRGNVQAGTSFGNKNDPGRACARSGWEGETSPFSRSHSTTLMELHHFLKCKY